MLAEVELALGLGEFGLGAGFDLGAERDEFELFAEVAPHPGQTRHDVGVLQKGLFFGGPKVQSAGHEIRQLSRFFDVHFHHLHFLGQVGDEGNHLLELLGNVAGEGLHLDGLGGDVLDLLDAGLHVGLGLGVGHDPDACNPAHQDPHGVVGKTQHPDDGRRGPDFVEVGRFGVFDGAVLLGDEGDEPVTDEGFIDEADGFFAADDERHDEEREGHDFAERQNGQLPRQVQVARGGIHGGHLALRRLVVGHGGLLSTVFLTTTLDHSTWILIFLRRPC